MLLFVQQWRQMAHRQFSGRRLPAYQGSGRLLVANRPTAELIAAKHATPGFLAATVVPALVSATAESTRPKTADAVTTTNGASRAVLRPNKVVPEHFLLLSNDPHQEELTTTMQQPKSQHFAIVGISLLPPFGFNRRLIYDIT